LKPLRHDQFVFQFDLRRKGVFTLAYLSQSTP